MFAGKYLLYEVQCVKHEHLTRILCVYCSELRLLVICSFCFLASLMFILSQNAAKLANKSQSHTILHYILLPCGKYLAQNFVLCYKNIMFA